MRGTSENLHNLNAPHTVYGLNGLCLLPLCCQLYNQFHSLKSVKCWKWKDAYFAILAAVCKEHKSATYGQFVTNCSLFVHLGSIKPPQCTLISSTQLNVEHKMYLIFITSYSIQLSKTKNKIHPYMYHNNHWQALLAVIDSNSFGK